MMNMLQGVEAIGWIAGSWVTLKDGHDVEEIWMQPKDGVVMGLTRWRKEGVTRREEYMRIGDHEGTMSLALQHGFGYTKGFSFPTSLASLRSAHEQNRSWAQCEWCNRGGRRFRNQSSPYKYARRLPRRRDRVHKFQCRLDRDSNPPFPPLPARARHLDLSRPNQLSLRCGILLRAGSRLWLCPSRKLFSACSTRHSRGPAIPMPCA